MNLLDYKAKKKFAQKHLLCLQDYSADEILQVLCLALKLKNMQKQNLPHAYLAGQSLGMLFTKSSTRTRVSFEVGIMQLGGHGIFLSGNDIQLGRGETIEDTAKVLSRYVDAIMIRTFLQSDVEGLAQHGQIPVINGLTDDFHPCQALADILTMYEYKNKLQGLKLAYLGDGNNVAHSLMIICSKLGVDFSLGCPSEYMPNPKVIKWAQENAKQSQCKFIITQNPEETIKNADAVYTDVFASMGQEAEAKERIQHFLPYQVNAKLMSFAKPNAIFLHCLPAHRGEEVTSDVIDGAQSMVFDQAENRLHAQKAVMVALMHGMEL